MGSLLVRLITWLIALGIIGSIIFAGHYTLFATSNQYSNDTFSFTVSKGMTMRAIAEDLENEGVVHSQNGIIFHNQFNPVDNLQIGEYTLSLPASPADIVDQIGIQSQRFANDNTPIIPTKKVLIREGENIDKIAEILSEKKLVNKKIFIDLVQKPNSSLRSEFSFLPEPLNCTYGTISNCAKYYLEGYLYPDTYEIKEGSSEEDIVKLFLENFERKVVMQIPQSTRSNLQEIITLASLVEKETGRPIEGVNSSNRDELKREREKVSGVFYNRIDAGMKLGSDPTIGYWANRTVCQQTLEIKNCLFINDPLTEHKLNTYNIAGLPIGPITNPQVAVIQSVVNADENDFLFFVSDKFGKKYFAQNFAGHQSNIAKVKQINNS